MGARGCLAEAQQALLTAKAFSKPHILSFCDSTPRRFYREDVLMRLCTTSPPMNHLAKFIPAHRWAQLCSLFHSRAFDSVFSSALDFLLNNSAVIPFVQCCETSTK